jgi:hypothetical protein
MSLDRYLQTNIMQVAPERTVGVVAGVWLVTVAIAAAWMLAVLFPFEPSFNFQAARHESASVISNAGGQAVKGDRLTSAKPSERRAVERIGAKSARYRFAPSFWLCSWRADAWTEPSTRF